MNCSNCQTRTEKMRKEFVSRTSRLANKVNHLIDFSDWTQEMIYTAPLAIRGDKIQRKQHLAGLMRLPKL